MATDFDRMMEAAEVLCRCKSQTQVGELLELGDNADQILTNWKSRGIPKSRIISIATILGCNPYWLINGSGEMTMTVEYLTRSSKPIASNPIV